jgi:hypothetical protein
MPRRSRHKAILEFSSSWVLECLFADSRSFAFMRGYISEVASAFPDAYRSQPGSAPALRPRSRNSSAKRFLSS